MPHRTPFLLAALVTLAATPALTAQGHEDGRRCAAVVAGDAGAHAEAERLAGGDDAGVAAFHRGCVAWVRQGTAKAAPHFERATKLRPESATAHDWMGRAFGEQLARANPLRQAMLAPRVRGSFERAVLLDPGNLDARAWLVRYYLNAPRIGGGSAEKAWAQIDEIRRRDAYRGAMLAAEVHAERKDAAVAARELTTLVAQHPDSSAPLLRLASILGDQRRFAEAVALLDAFRLRHPDDLPVREARERYVAAAERRHVHPPR